MNDFKKGCPEAITTFYDAFQNVTAQGKQYFCEKIEIKSMARCRLVRLHCLHTLSEAISMLTNQQDVESIQVVKEIT